MDNYSMNNQSKEFVEISREELEILDSRVVVRQAKITPTNTTPSIKIDLDLPWIEILGRSTPEGALGFYKPVLNLLDSLKPKTTGLKVDLRIEYFNTSSTKCLVLLFEKIKSKMADKSAATINWYFEEDDEDLEELGEDLQSQLELRFNMIAVPVDDSEEDYY